MKIYVLMEYDGYDYCDYSYPRGALVLPDDFDEKVAREQWQEETFTPVRWKNQHGEGFTKRQTMMTIPFEDWLESKYPKAELVNAGCF